MNSQASHAKVLRQNNHKNVSNKISTKAAYVTCSIEFGAKSPSR